MPRIPFYLSHPHLAARWSPLNKSEFSQSVGTITTATKYLWTGECGHHWEAPASFIEAGRKCSYCSNMKLLAGFNDLATKLPLLAEQWHPSNNLTPQDVMVSSQEIVMWKCSYSHEWTTKVIHRTGSGGRGCPVCANKKTVAGINDLPTTHPLLSKEWNDSDRSVTTVTSGSDYSAEWICARRHIWRATVCKRAKGTGCPYCDSKKISAGDNDLAYGAPEIAKEYSKKNHLNPNEIALYSSKRVIWECTAYGHEWETSVKSRTSSKYGCPICANKEVLAGFNDLATINPTLAKEWGTQNILGAESVVAGSKSYAFWKCKEKGHEWEAIIDNRNRGANCPSCAKHVSGFEREISNFIIGLVGEDKVILNNRTLISPREVDIYIPSFSVAIEANGNFWHSEKQGKGKNYHRDKMQKCSEAGVQLIQIWDDQWQQKKPIVKQMIASKLGYDNRERIFARNTVVSFVPLADAKNFTQANHIQGFASGTHYLGLYQGDRLVAVMILKKDGNSLRLERYSTSAAVIGGHSKLMKWVENNLVWESIITFADLEVSDGGLYEKTGWKLDAILEPDYHYLYKNTKFHKFNFRLKRFRDDPELLWEENLSERQLAELNGLDRVWDSGKVRYIYHNPRALL